MITQTGMIQRQSIEGMVSAYNGAAGKMREAFQAMADAASLLRSITPDRSAGLSLFPHGELSDWCFTGESNPETAGRIARALADCLANIKNKAWAQIVKRADIERLMCSSDKDKLHKQLQEGQLPDLTAENVEAFITRTREDLPAIMDRAIAEVFQALRPRCSDHYKTNQGNVFKIGRKVIHGWAVEGDYSGNGHLRVRYGSESFFQSMDTAFHLLDGKLPPSYPGDALTAIRADLQKGARSGSCTYWNWRAFANGNMHFEFTRADLLDRLNAVGGRGEVGLPKAW